MRTYELTTLNHLQKMHHLVGYGEQQRFRDIVLAWKRENRNADVIRQMLFEELVRTHLLIQRLADRTRFFDGSPTDYRNLRQERCADVSEEDMQRKQREWDKHYPVLVKFKIELLKIALANKIEIVGDLTASSLFSALDERERKQLDKYRNNGSSGQTGKIYS